MCRRPRKVEMDTWQADEEIKKGQRFAKIVNDHQSRISTDVSTVDSNT